MQDVQADYSFKHCFTDFPFVATPVKNSCFKYTVETRTERFYRSNCC